MVVLELDSTIYDIEAVQSALYRGSAFLNGQIATDGDKIVCSLFQNAKISDDDYAKAIEDFRKDLVDEQLRLKIGQKTEAVRNLILGVAFSNTGLSQ